MPIEVTIIVPVYNTQPYLRRCLNSILAQDMGEWEAILIDDGSTDQSGKICDEYAKADSRFRCIHKRNAGANAARKQGVIEAQGKYIGFVDSDDWIEEDMYSVMYKTAEERSADIVVCAYTNEYGENIVRKKPKLKEGYYDRERIETEILPVLISGGGFFGSCINAGLPNKLYRKAFFLPFVKASRNEFVMAEDAAILFPAVIRAQSMYVYQNFYCYHVVEHQGSVTKSYKKEYFKMCKSWRKFMIESCVPAYSKAKGQIDNYFLSLAIGAALNEYHSYAPTGRKEKYKKLKEIFEDKEIRMILKNINPKKYGFMAGTMIRLAKYRGYLLLHAMLLLRK